MAAFDFEMVISDDPNLREQERKARSSRLIFDSRFEFWVLEWYKSVMARFDLNLDFLTKKIIDPNLESQSKKSSYSDRLRKYH